MQWNRKVFNWECNCGSIIHWQFSSHICATATCYQQINCKRKVSIVSTKSKPVGRKKVQMNSNSIAFFFQWKKMEMHCETQKSRTKRDKNEKFSLLNESRQKIVAVDKVWSISGMYNFPCPSDFFWHTRLFSCIMNGEKNVAWWIASVLHETLLLKVFYIKILYIYSSSL